MIRKKYNNVSQQTGVHGMESASRGISLLTGRGACVPQSLEGGWEDKREALDVNVSQLGPDIR